MRPVHALHLALLMCIPATACGGDGDGSSYGTEPGTAIGPAGGNTSLATGAGLTVPPDALDGEVLLAVQSLDEATTTALGALLDDDMTLRSELFAITPHGTQFQRPVTVTIPYRDDDASLSIIRLADESDESWEWLEGGAFSGSVASIDVRSLSIFAVAARVAADGGMRAASQGTQCSDGGSCESGHCVDGVCCDGACAGGCEACAVTAGGSVDGACAPIASGLDPDMECGGGLTCDGSGACHVANGTQCSDGGSCESGHCVDGVCCDGACAGGCEACHSSATLAADGTCAHVRDGDDPGLECAADLTCNGAGACHLDNGAQCGVDDDCESTRCIDGVCCDAPCDGQCRACLGSLTAGSDGQCGFITAGMDPDAECMPGQSCDGAGACAP